MDTYKIADVTVCMACSGEALTRQAAQYRIEPLPTGARPDITIDMLGEELKIGKEKYPHLSSNEWEYIRTGSVFYRDILDYGGFGLHASAVAVDNRAVLFSGPCGAGKSTHAGLWRKAFGSRAVIINDDKPALRSDDGIFYACGTPWSGKSALNINIRVPLAAVVFLKQAEKNRIRRLDGKEAVRMLIYQSLRPCSNMDKTDKLLTLIDALMKNTPVYELSCNISPKAVELVYDMIGKEGGWRADEN